MKITECSYVKAIVNSNEYIIQNSPQNISAVICSAGADSDIKIQTPDCKTVLSLYGPFLDQCTDFDYVNKKLKPEVIAMQLGEKKVPEIEFIKGKPPLFQYHGRK